MPPDHRGWLDDRQGIPPRLPMTSQDHPQSAIPVPEARGPTAESTGEHPDLVAEREVLQRELTLRPKR
jgi:hypothetical protein